MRYKYFFILFVIVTCCASCGPGKSIFKKPLTPQEALFESAEQKFQNEQYSEARDLYLSYVDQYPESNLVPAARLKIGMIKTEQGKFDQARSLFREMIRQFPETDFDYRARVEILYTYYQEGRFQAVIDYSEEMEKELLHRNQRVRTGVIVGDAYMAIESYPEAYLAFLDAFESVRKDQRDLVGQRLMAAISFLETDFIDREIQRFQGRPPSGYLLYQQGVNYMSRGRTGDALSTFSSFIEQFPEHPYAEAAGNRIDTLESSAYFQGRRIGCLLPLSGQYETFGRKALQGIEFALVEAGQHDDGGPPFELLIRDTAGDPRQTREAVEDLCEQRVAAIIGPMVMVAEAAEVAQKYGVPIITLTQKPKIAETGEYVFRNFLTPEMQVKTLVDYLMGTLGMRRFAVLYPDEPYGNTFLHLFWDELLDRNGRIVGVENYNPTHTDFAESIKKLVGLYYAVPEDLKRAEVTPEDIDAVIESETISYNLLYKDTMVETKDDPNHGRSPFDMMENPEADDDGEPEPKVDFDAIFIPDSPQKAGLIIPQLRYHDISDVYLLGTNLWHSDKLIDIARYQIRQAVIPEGFFAGSSRPRVIEFVEDFGSIYDREPEFIEAVSYDTALILFDLIARPEISNRAALKDALLSMPVFDGVTGKTVFAETGEAEKETYLLKIERGEFLEITD